tara:strand:- start:10785 stop:12008 length:1224 start_codon:yes stop_codon:yes gene_type:complete
MGAAYGHMNHPFDDKNLTFGDMKNMIELGLSGQLNREDNVTEKLDGQNLMVSWKNDKLVAARNKGHVKNSGNTSLDLQGIIDKFDGRGDIRDAFVFAMEDLESAISLLTEKQKNKIFDGGNNWMNLEIMWPQSSNVIDYDVAQVVFHGALKYDDDANVIGEVEDSARMLAGMIHQINENIQSKYSIGKPQFLKIPRQQDFSKKRRVYFNKIKKLQKEYNLSDKDTLGMYHQRFWEEYIYNSSRQFRFKINNEILEGLTRRWAFSDKSYKIPKIKKDIKNKKFLNWVLNIDKNDHSSMVKENMKPFEVLFFEVGAEIMKNISGFLAVNPNKTIQNIKNKVKESISFVRRGGDLKKLNKLKVQLERLNAIGGLDSIVPSEGIVFKYKGNTYKFTGAFAPVNQITGLMMY